MAEAGLALKSCPLIQNLHVFLYLYIYSLIQEQQKSLNAEIKIKMTMSEIVLDFEMPVNKTGSLGLGNLLTSKRHKDYSSDHQRGASLLLSLKS